MDWTDDQPHLYPPLNSGADLEPSLRNGSGHGSLAAPPTMEEEHGMEKKSRRKQMLHYIKLLKCSRPAVDYSRPIPGSPLRGNRRRRHRFHLDKNPVHLCFRSAR